MPPAIATNAPPDPQRILCAVLGCMLGIYFMIAVFRHFVMRLSWQEAFMMKHENPRIVNANRSFRQDRSEDQPKVATVVRFKIDEAVVSEEFEEIVETDL